MGDIQSLCNPVRYVFILYYVIPHFVDRLYYISSDCLSSIPSLVPSLLVSLVLAAASLEELSALGEACAHF